MSDSDRGQEVAGRMVLAVNITGWLSLLVAVSLLLSNEPGAAGMALIAAALAFGLGANAVLRD